mgnify:CR=1 FL=1
MLSWELEDWITDAGGDVLDKRMANVSALFPIENLLYQVWVLDTGARNGTCPSIFAIMATSNGSPVKM